MLWHTLDELKEREVIKKVTIIALLWSVCAGWPEGELLSQPE